MYEKTPIGMDHKERPIISWKFTTQEKGMKQKKVRILVGTSENGSDMWDSDILSTDCSIGTAYEGKELQPCTEYYITLETTNQKDEKVIGSTTFETGLLDPTMKAWDGAKWIGAPEYYVASDTIGVFVLESTITIAEGSSRAGIVFGANDERLLNRERNEYLIEGENYIRYELNIDKTPATIDIFRVGYHKDDKKDVPFCSFPVVDVESADKKLVITDQNKYEAHFLQIEVIGNCAYTYVDGIKVDAVEIQTWHGKDLEARQLNPMSNNDITCFPRICDIGYFVAKGNKANFDGLRVRNYRTPSKIFFEMDTENGIDLEGVEEDAQFVTKPDCHALPMLRREIKVSKPLAKARLYATARGIYDCMINGNEISDQFFAPGASQFDKHLMYQTYDVTDYLNEGDNGIGFTLAPGWWSDAQTFTVRNYNFWGDKVSLLAKIVLTYTDGTQEVIVTDDINWQYYGEGPYKYASFFQGEYFDANLSHIYDNYSKPGFEIKGVKNPSEINTDCMEEYYGLGQGFGAPWPAMNHTEPMIIGSINAPVKAVEELSAKSMSEPAPGLFIYDLEQEIAGVPVVKLKGKKGTKVCLRFGEILYPKLEEYGELHGRMLQMNLRDASNTDNYILRGDETGEWYTPKFTFHGYRYIEITGLEVAPALEDVKSLQLSSIHEITGEIEVDNDLVNRLIKNVKYSQLSNFISIPTDCPQRNERMGWTGDGHVFCRTATYQSDSRLFYYRYLQAIKDLQTDDGDLPNVAPFGGGFGGITYGSAMHLIVWELYQQYGDRKIIDEYYDSMQKYMEFLKKKGMPGTVYVGPLGDWLAPEETDNYLIWNAFYCKDARLMKEYAIILGKQEDVDYYEKIEQETKSYWNKTFVDKNTGKTLNTDGTVNDTQCSYSLGLYFEMFHMDVKKKAFDNLARKTVEVGYTVSTGFFGTSPLNPMLSEGGYPEIAYRLLTQTAFPSWLYPVTQGASTIWERWNGYTVESGFGGLNAMNSFNHYSFGSVISWIYEYVIGIRRDESHPGYGHFILKPTILGFEKAKGGFETPYGRIESAYQVEENRITYTCKVPANTTATLVISGRTEELGSGEYTFVIEN